MSRSGKSRVAGITNKHKKEGPTLGDFAYLSAGTGDYRSLLRELNRSEIRSMMAPTMASPSSGTSRASSRAEGISDLGGFGITCGPAPGRYRAQIASRSYSSSHTVLHSGPSPPRYSKVCAPSSTPHRPGNPVASRCLLTSQSRTRRAMELVLRLAFQGFRRLALWSPSPAFAIATCARKPASKGTVLSLRAGRPGQLCGCGQVQLRLILAPSRPSGC